VQAHPSFPLPDITLPDSTSPRPANTTPDVFHVGSWETFTEPEVTPAIVASADRVGPIAGSPRASPGNIPSLPVQSSSDVIKKASSVTAASPQWSPVVTPITHVEATSAIVTCAEKPAVLADALPGRTLNIGCLSSLPSTDIINNTSSLMPKSNHPSTAILTHADRPALPSDAFPGGHLNITSFSAQTATDAIRKSSSVTPKSTHPSPSVDIGSVPISTSHSDNNSLATRKLMIQELNPVIVGPLGRPGVPPVSSSCPLPRIDLNLTSLQYAPPPNPIGTASPAMPKGDVVTAPMPFAPSVQTPASVAACLPPSTSSGMTVPAPVLPLAQPIAAVVNPAGTSEYSGVPETAGLLCQPNDTITNSEDSTPSYTPHATPLALPLTNPFPFTPSLRISIASPTLRWHTWPISPVPDISRLHVDAPATPLTALQHATVSYDSPHPLGSAVLMIPTGNAPMNTPGTPSSTSDVSMDISSDGKHVNEV
jgi:hypothetical protein